MPSQTLPLLLVLLLAVAACNPFSNDAEGVDLILINGDVWTVDDSMESAEAIAISGDKIVALGSTSEMEALGGPNTQVIDLQGNFVLPGFIDTHVHFASAARFLEFNLMKTASQDEFVNRVTELLELIPSGDWILGGFWGAYDQWTAGSSGGVAREPFAPDLSLIEELTENNPVFLHKFDGSQFAANRSALEAAGVDPNEPYADGVTFETDSAGVATGLFSGEGSTKLFESVAPESFSSERRVLQTEYALGVIAQNGVTTVSDMSDDEQLEIYRDLHEEGELSVRVDFRYPLDRWPELAEQGIKTGPGLSDPWIRLGGLKGHIDGIMGTSSARFFEPYNHNPGSRGRWRRLMLDENGKVNEQLFLEYLTNADAAGLQLTVHAIGDEANHLLMNFHEEMNRRNGLRDRRFRLVHAQVIGEDDFARLGPLNLIAEVQPYHMSDDMRWMEGRIGYDRSSGAYAFKKIRDSGAMLAFGSDWPGTSASEYPINPMFGLYAAVTRQTLTGEPGHGWFPDERITMEEAIRAYTLNGAFASFEEDVKGSLTPGKLADIVVLSHDLLAAQPEEILTTQTLMTLVGGKIVYQDSDVFVE